MKCERLFKEVMSRILANGSVEQDDNKIIDMSLKLSKVYAVWGDHEKASSGFRFCVDTQERKVAAAGASVDEAGAIMISSKRHDQKFYMCRTPLHCGG